MANELIPQPGGGYQIMTPQGPRFISGQYADEEYRSQQMASASPMTPVPPDGSMSEPPGMSPSPLISQQPPGMPPGPPPPAMQAPAPPPGFIEQGSPIPPPQPGMLHPGGGDDTGPVLSRDQKMQYLMAPAQGGAGMSQRGLAARAQQGVPTPKGVTTTTEDAVPDLPGFAEQRADASLNLRTAMQGRMDAQEEAAQAEAAGFRLQKSRLDTQSAAAEAKLAAGQAAYEKKRKELDAWTQAVATKEVDPGRIFRGAGALSAIGYIISDAFSAYAAGLQGRNHTSLLQQVIERDIRLQENQIAREGANAKNALSVLMHDYDGDKDAAKEHLRYLMQASAQTQAHQLAAQTKAATMRPEGQELLAKMESDRVAQEQAIATRAQGKTTTKLEQDIKYPVMGGGALTPKLLHERADALSAMDKALGGAGALSPGEAKVEERSLRDDQQKLGEKLAPTAKGRVAISSMAKAAGLRRSPDTGEWEIPEGQAIPGHYLPFVPGSSSGQLLRPESWNKARALKQSIAAGEAIIGQSLSGASVSAKQDEQIAISLHGTLPSDMIYGLNLWEKLITDNENDIKAGYGPDAVGRIEQSRKALRDTGRANATQREQQSTQRVKY